jgi:hypothetical protein
MKNAGLPGAAVLSFPLGMGDRFRVREVLALPHSTFALAMHLERDGSSLSQRGISTKAVCVGYETPIHKSTHSDATDIIDNGCPLSIQNVRFSAASNL